VRPTAGQNRMRRARTSGVGNFAESGRPIDRLTA
jgi:hypothetical protein